ncbi:MAG TPA: phosphatase PAP2 family protein [Thermoanaerobaculia bacterium]|jgi:undecaprenyl-diphosphatase|nr:phosphatase PAP2 family protein [Thermoanaerobaculia bacterium]
MYVSRIGPDPIDIRLDDAAFTAGDQFRASAASFFARLDRKEERLVERCVDHASRWRLLPAARMATRAGNGWLYPIASAVLLLGSFQYAMRCIAAASVSLAIAFVIYPSLKKIIARQRPCHNNELLSDIAPLDRYSFPSGQAMTAAAFGVPIIVAAPLSALPIAVGGCLLVSWSRMALGHHYLSDIIAGTIIGGGVAALAMLVI